MDKDLIQVPYIALEDAEAKHERTERRFIVALIIAIALLFASNMAWLWFFNSFDIESSEITVDSTDAGNANYVGKNGVIDNGRSESKDN